MEVIMPQLPDAIIHNILNLLPYESVARLRTVCKDWNKCLSDENFLSWRRENLKEYPWLLIVKERRQCYRLNVSTKEVKAFAHDRVVLASVGGLLLILGSSWAELFLINPLNRTRIQIPPRERIPKEKRVLVCNPTRETFVQLPLPILRKDNGIKVGEILWKDEQYKVVAVHQTFIEVYDFSKKSWVIVQQLPERIIEDIVFFKGLFFCTVRSFNVFYKWSVKVLSIKEDCTCHMVHLSLSSPPYECCSLGLTPHLVVCGSTFVLITLDSQLCLWKLEHGNSLSITSDLSWKAIAKMPQQVSEFLFVHPSIFLATENCIFFLSKDSGKLAFFNKENGSWSCFKEKFITIGDHAYLYDLRPDILLFDISFR